MDYQEFQKLIFKKTEERLREEYIRYLLAGENLPPDDTNGFIWWLIHVNPELYLKPNEEQD